MAVGVRRVIGLDALDHGPLLANRDRNFCNFAGFVERNAHFFFQNELLLHHEHFLDDGDDDHVALAARSRRGLAGLKNAIGGNALDLGGGAEQALADDLFARLCQRAHPDPAGHHLALADADFVLGKRQDVGCGCRGLLRSVRVVCGH